MSGSLWIEFGLHTAVDLDQCTQGRHTDRGIQEFPSRCVYVYETQQKKLLPVRGAFRVNNDGGCRVKLETPGFICLIWDVAAGEFNRNAYTRPYGDLAHLSLTRCSTLDWPTWLPSRCPCICNHFDLSLLWGFQKAYYYNCWQQHPDTIQILTFCVNLQCLNQNLAYTQNKWCISKFNKLMWTVCLSE